MDSIKIGKNTTIEEGAKLYGPLTIGDNCYIFSGAIIGFPKLNNLKNYKNKKETIIGNNVIIYPNAIIYEGVNIKNNVKIFHNALIREEVNIGDNCIIGTNSVLDGYITIRKNTLIHSLSYICSKTKIGNQVFIGPKVGFVNEKTAQSRINLPSIKNYRDLEKGPIIEDGVSIGEGAILLPVTIGKNAVIGSGAVVTKDIPSNEIWVGNPAKKLKDRDF